MEESLFGGIEGADSYREYVLKHIDTTPKEELHKLLPEEWEDA